MKKSIYISNPAAKIIGVTDATNLSGRINSIIARYGQICAKSCPALTVPEWMAIIDILNSAWRETESPKTDIARLLWAEILDSIPDGIEDNWPIDAEALSDKIHQMPYEGQCAIIEVVSRFWDGHDLQEWGSDQERLEYFGAKVLRQNDQISIAPKRPN